jgi:hypothetical protein
MTKTAGGINKRPCSIHPECLKGLSALCLFLAALPIYLFVSALPVHALPQDRQMPSGVVCPQQQEIIDGLASMYVDLQKVQMELQNILSGKDILGSSLEVLLVVDPMDEAATARRRTELQEAVRPFRITPASELPPLIQCALSDKQLHDSAEQFLVFRRQVDVLRLRFLQYPKEQIKQILDLQADTARAAGGFAKRLSEERTSTIENLAKANAQLRISEHSALNMPAGDQENLATKAALLAKAKVVILNSEMWWLDEISSRRKFYSDAVRRLLEIKGVVLKTDLQDAINNDLSQADNPSFRFKRLEDIQKDYQDTVKLWRVLVDKAYEKSYANVYKLKLPALPESPGTINESAGELPQAKAYRDSYNEAIQARDSFWKLNTETFDKENDALHRLLLSSGKLRAELLDELLRRNDSSPLAINEEYFQDLARELKIVPYSGSALLSIKLLDIQHDMRLGIAGFLKLAKDIFHFMLFFCFFVFFWLGMKKALAALDRLQGSIIKGRSKSKAATRFALRIQQLIPYMPWLVILPAAEIGRMLIEKSVFSEFIHVLPYLKIYCIYRILMLLVIDLLSYIAQQAEAAQFEAVQGKILRSARILGVFFLVSGSLLYAVESIVSQALAYRLAMKCFIFTGIILSAWAANNLRNELAEFIEEFAAFSLSIRLAKGCRGKFSLLWSLPALMIAMVIAVFRQGEKWGENFDLYKKVSARIFKHQLEIRTSLESADLKKDLLRHYACWFTPGECEDSSVVIIPRNDVLIQLKDMIVNWRAGVTGEHSVALCGEQGAGKSLLIGRLEESFDNLRVLRATVPPKLLTRSSVFTFLETLFQVPLKDGAVDLTSADRNMPKTLILIDDAQNFFLSRLGGFEGYRAFVDMINAETENLFWCAAFNNFSWSYLESVFGLKHSFDIVKKVPRWSDADIREMIYARHRKTDYRLSFDGIVNATSNRGSRHELAHAESSFFRLLWQQSDGNPAAALYYWLSSLTPQGNHLVKAGLPEDPRPNRFSGLLEEELFIYTEIIRHGNLSPSDLVSVTNLRDLFVRKVLKEGAENGTLSCSDDGRYDIRTARIGPLSFNLKGKNFIYGD